MWPVISSPVSVTFARTVSPPLVVLILNPLKPLILLKPLPSSNCKNLLVAISPIIFPGLPGVTGSIKLSAEISPLALILAEAVIWLPLPTINALSPLNLSLIGLVEVPPSKTKPLLSKIWVWVPRIIPVLVTPDGNFNNFVNVVFEALILP